MPNMMPILSLARYRSLTLSGESLGFPRGEIQKPWLPCLFCALFLVLAPAGAPAQMQNTGAKFRDGVVLAGFYDGVTEARQATIIASVGATVERVIGVQVHVLAVPPGSVLTVIDALKQYSEVRYAEPDYKQHVSGAPNDPDFSLQWAFQNTGQSIQGTVGTAGADEGAVAAWSVTTGSKSVVVAVVDTGIQYNHPDLAPNVWSNPGGIGGCAAGTHGYNVLTSTCDPLDDDTVYNGHGSHVSGIIGAATNNGIGVAGVNWQTNILAVKWVDSSGNGNTSDLITALDWVIEAKQAGVNVRVVNDSQTWSGTAASQALSDEIDSLGSNDILFVTAAGNDGISNDTTPRYPCSYNQANEICVAASDPNDQLWSSSDYGVQAVHLAAPGVNIYSTLDTVGVYGYISGCSMAAAQVSGAAALVLSQGYKDVSDLKSTLLSSVDQLPAFSGVTITGGRLNICKAIAGCSQVPANETLPVISGTAQLGATLTASAGSWSEAPKSYTYQWSRCDNTDNNCSQISGATASSYTLAGSDVSNTLRVTVTATNSFGSASATSAATAIIVAAPLSITTNSLNGGNVGTAYSATLSASGGVPPYSWTRTSGNLPAGLTLSSAGAITGTPTASGTSSFTVQVKDSASQTMTQTLTLVISAAPPAPSVTVSATPAAQTVTAGQTASYTIAVTGQALAGSVSLTCGNLPNGAACGFAPPALTLGSGSGTSTLTLSTTPRTSAQLTTSRIFTFAFLPLGLGLMMLPTPRRLWSAGIGLALLLAALIACGGTAGSSGSTSGNTTSPAGTPAGTYSVTVTASSGNVQNSTAVKVTVQ
jgi:subtilisin family serine protease